MLQGKCTVTCPKGHSIRFDWICVVLVYAHVMLPKMAPMTVKISIGLGFLLFQFRHIDVDLMFLSTS